MTNQISHDSSSYRWKILTVLFLSQLSFAVTVQSIPPVMSLVIAHFHLSHHEAGLLMGMFSLPGIFLSLPSGMLSDRWGVKPVGIVALILTAGGTLLVAVGQSFPVVLAGRMIAGMGAVTLVVIVPKAVAQWFAGGEMGMAMGLFNTAMPLGTIVMLNVGPVLARFGGWRTGIWATLIFTALATVIFITLYRNPATSRSPAPENPAGTRSGRKIGLPIWLVGAAWGFFNMSIMSLFTFAPDFLVGRGLNLGRAGFDTSLVMVGSMLFSPVIGYLTDRAGRKAAFIGIGGVGMAVLLLFLPAVGGNFGVLFLAVGVAAALIPAPIFSLVADVVDHDRLGLGYGILSTILNLGMFVGPQIVGWGRDITGSYTASFWLMAFFALLATVSIAVMTPYRRRAS
jgi:predicted MFS family arabinose efflux permease